MRFACQRARVLALAGLPVLVLLSPAAVATPTDPLGWFAPWVGLDDGDRRDLAAGEVVAETLGAEGPYLAILLAGAVDVDAATFVRKVRNSQDLWQSEKVPHVVHFSNPPQLADLASLELREEDLSALTSCRPGDCDVKLTAPEIERIRRTILRAGPAWQEPVQREFREILLSRVLRYQDGGLAGLGPFEDHDEPVDPEAVAAELLERSSWLPARAPEVARFLRTYPAGALPDAESFMYWLETTHTPKPTVQAVHVLIHRPESIEVGDPDVLVVSRQIFSTHYVNGSLSVSVLLRGSDTPSRRVLGYASLSHVDGLGGWFSGLRRFFAERRIRGRAAEIFALQRERLEE